MKPYRNSEITRTVAYKLPKDAKGEVHLNVRGGASMNWIQELLRKQKEEGVPQAQKEQKKKEKDIKLSDYVREVNKADRNNDIIIEYAPARSRKAPATEEEAEAMSLAAMLAGGRNKQSVPVDYIVDGEQQVTVKLSKASADQ